MHSIRRTCVKVWPRPAFRHFHACVSSYSRRVKQPHFKSSCLVHEFWLNKFYENAYLVFSVQFVSIASFVCLRSLQCHTVSSWPWVTFKGMYSRAFPGFSFKTRVKWLCNSVIMGWKLEMSDCPVFPYYINYFKFLLVTYHWRFFSVLQPVHSDQGWGVS